MITVIINKSSLMLLDTSQEWNNDFLVVIWHKKELSWKGWPNVFWWEKIEQTSKFTLQTFESLLEFSWLHSFKDFYLIPRGHLAFIIMANSCLVETQSPSSPHTGYSHQKCYLKRWFWALKKKLLHFLSQTVW